MVSNFYLYYIYGITSQYALDLLLINLNECLALLFPFLWDTLALNVIPDDDWNIKLRAMGLAAVVYVISVWFRKKKNNMVRI